VGTRIFVGNLAYGTSDAALQGHFEARGFDVRSARVISDRETGRSRGFGFVELGGEDEARRAIAELDGAELEGRRLSLREAHDRPQGGPPRDGKPPRPRGGRFESSGPVVERVGSPEARRERASTGERPFRGAPSYGGGAPAWPSSPPAQLDDRGKGDGRRRKFEDRKTGKRRHDRDDDDDW
jgi:RNA recognition motif-containing protein